MFPESRRRINCALKSVTFQSVLGLGHEDYIIPRYAAIFFSVSVFPAWVAMTCETLDYGGLC